MRRIVEQSTGVVHITHQQVLALDVAKAHAMGVQVVQARQHLASVATQFAVCVRRREISKESVVDDITYQQVLAFNAAVTNSVGVLVAEDPVALNVI